MKPAPIIVPASPQPGNVSIYNIEKFLLKAEYDEELFLDNPDASKVEIQKELKARLSCSKRPPGPTFYPRATGSNRNKHSLMK